MVGPGFPTTRWSVVLVAGADPREAREALEALCGAYWGPLYAFIRRRGFDPDDAQDLTQGFLLSLLQRDDLRRLHPEAGRFRSFLCASVKHFISNELDRARALKRGGGTVTVSIDAHDAEAFYRLEPRTDLDPEKVFERRWALTVLRRAEERLRREAERDGHAQELRDLLPLVAGTGPREPYADVAVRLGTTEDAVKMKVHRLRKRFGRHVREEIADTVREPSDVEDELRHLLAIVRESPVT